ncbi:MAG: two-component system response regulator [Rhodospirillaceae bacterium]|nr:MAG: two-component system response regulator [Rhodospirillaceae bacterium]
MQGYDLHKISVLIVEPKFFMRKIITEILNEFGITNIQIAESSKEGFSLFTKFSPDLVLSDWSPTLNGIQFVTDIRQSKQSPNPYVPIIVISAHNSINHVFTARDAGMTEFLVKPVRANLLYARIQSVIERHRVFVRSAKFFGPDRRRRRILYNGLEKRTHENMSGSERRLKQHPRRGRERRHGFSGYTPPETRAGGRA